MKVTITADTGEQELEITRQTARVRSADPATDETARLRDLDALVAATVQDARRAAGLEVLDALAPEGPAAAELADGDISPLRLHPDRDWSVTTDGRVPDTVRVDVRDADSGDIRSISFPTGIAGAVAAALQRITP